MIDVLGVLASGMCVGGALYAINARQLMRGVLGLAVFFIGIATFFAQLGAWYLAVGQLFLFVGGVVTLFVLAFNAARTPVYHGKGIIAALIALLLLGVLSAFLVSPTAPSSPSLVAFARDFFTNYGWVLNLALLLLFSGVIASQHLMEDQ